MAKPRITVELSEEGGASGVVNLLLNEEGRALLITSLQSLSRENDHFHMFAPEWGADNEPLSLKPYKEGSSTAGHLKVHYRPDDWDREYFPHLFEPEGGGK